jgi:CRISPR system Cascade subunit CasA
MIKRRTDALAAIAEGRVSDISKVRKVLWSALAKLFAKGTSEFTDSVTDKAARFAKAFEQFEDARFFDGPLGLNEQIEADDPAAVRLAWYQDMAQRAEDILHDAFAAGPRSGEQRYRARAAALARLRGGLRKELPSLADYLDARRAQRSPDSEPRPPISDPEPVPTGAK